MKTKLKFKLLTFITFSTIMFTGCEINDDQTKSHRDIEIIQDRFSLGDFLSLDINTDAFEVEWSSFTTEKIDSDTWYEFEISSLNQENADIDTYDDRYHYSLMCHLNELNEPSYYIVERLAKSDIHIEEFGYMSSKDFDGMTYLYNINGELLFTEWYQSGNMEIREIEKKTEFNRFNKSSQARKCKKLADFDDVDNCSGGGCVNQNITVETWTLNFDVTYDRSGNITNAQYVDRQFEGRRVRQVMNCSGGSGGSKPPKRVYKSHKTTNPPNLLDDDGPVSQGRVANTICSNLQFNQIGNSHYATISNLGFSAGNGGRVLNMNYSTGVCIQISDLVSSRQASNMFRDAWKQTMIDVRAYLQNLPPNAIPTENSLKDFAWEWLKVNIGGNGAISLSRTYCAGSKVQTVTYCPI